MGRGLLPGCDSRLFVRRRLRCVVSVISEIVYRTALCEVYASKFEYGLMSVFLQNPLFALVRGAPAPRRLSVPVPHLVASSVSASTPLPTAS